MGSFVADEVIRALISQNHIVKSSKVLILGITFKENCPDIRNTGVVGVINRLKSFGINTTIYDPWANKDDVLNEYNLEITDDLKKEKYDAIILAVAHKLFKLIDFEKLKKSNTIIYDVKGFLEKSTHKL